MAKPAKVTPANSSRRWRAALPGIVLFLLVVAAYLPALRGQFIWDDDYNIIRSAPLRSWAGLWRIWFEPGATQQYYPLTHTSFWLDYQLWGLHPLPYHLENILLHAFSAVLVWRILLRLGARGAWFGAALFALHPVCVESVAWITERKNALSGFAFLASTRAAVEFWLPRPAVSSGKGEPLTGNPGADFGPWKYYGLACFLYLCAIWSKTATVGMPGVVLVLVWWKRGRLVVKDGVLLLPFVMAGLWMSLFTISIEHRLMLIGGNESEWQFSLVERFLIAARALWFYLGKLAWPHPLMFFYPRWNLSATAGTGWVALATAAGGLCLLWLKRRGWGRPALAAAGCFIALLFPMLGFFNVFFFRYSFVCDHFLYLAAIGPLALAAAGITGALGEFAQAKPMLKPAVLGAVLLLLGGLTWRQTNVYYSLETLWRDALAHNPDAWMAHVNLGIYLSQSGHFEEADAHYRKAIELRPNEHVAYYDLGLEAAIQGNLDQAAQCFNKTLQLCPSYALAHYQLGNVLTRQGHLDEAVHEYTQAIDGDPNLNLAHFNLGNVLARTGNTNGAVHEYAETLRQDPQFALAPFSLGNLLAAAGKLDQAVIAYQRALAIQPDYAAAHTALGRVLTAQGHPEEAIGHYQKALEIAPDSVDALANLGNALVHQDRFAEAITHYRMALRIEPNNSVIHYDLAVALNREGKAAEAQSELAEAKRLESEHAPVRP